jgi:uncharacterized repeat protein (TIGR03803 family)
MRASVHRVLANSKLMTVPCILFFCSVMAITSRAQTLTTLHSFDGSDGQHPDSSLIQATDGNFYGVTQNGGLTNQNCTSVGCGTVFKITPGGTLTTLYQFCSLTNCADGANPYGYLVQGTDGNFYGTTIYGGANLNGTVFKITSTGTLTTLHSFALFTDGAYPWAGLVQATDGNFYGTTTAGGLHIMGTVFKMTPAGALTDLYNFCSQGACVDGATPYAALVQGSDGILYGTTTQGGNSNYVGTLFKITTSGALTTLHTFCTLQNCADGEQPFAALLQASDGNFYGTTTSGHGQNAGTFFKITSTGTLTTLYTFCALSHCTDGQNPYGGVVQGSDGNFYGTTNIGGTGQGIIFKLTASGTLTTLYTFGGPDGELPYSGLVQGNDGNFYGTTHLGGSHNDGTVFRLTGPQLISTTTVLMTAPNPSNLNQTVIMTATVHAQSGTPVGNVVFSSDGVGIGTVALSNGVAVLNYSSLPIGTHAIVAVYQGGGGFSGSTSNIVQQVVELTHSTTAVTSSPNPSMFGELVTITATVGPPGPPTPTGTVGFTSNGAAIPGCAAVPLTALTAVCTTSTLAVGTDAIVATYSGDSNYMGSSGTLSQLVNPTPSAVQFVAVTPCRLVDTRQTGGAIQGGSSRDFPVQQEGGCNISATAAAYSLNVTVVPHGPLGYLTIWPTGEGRPVVSTLNSVDGRVKANAAIVPAGTSGDVSVYVTDTTNVILDIDGYFAPVSGSTLAFYPLSPCRVADTRDSTKPPGLGPPQLSSLTPRAFPVLTSTCIPTGVSPAAYSFNFTVVPGGHPVGYLSVWPTGQNQPVVSTLNDQTGTIVANAALVPAGTGGDVSVYATDNTQLVIDIDGYFAPAGQGGLSLYAVAPCRAFDTRHVGNGQPFQGILSPPVDVEHSQCGPPATARAYVFNATVIPPGSLGYLTLWPDGADRPTVSTLNASDGSITNNMAIVPTNNGKVDAYASGLTQLILDISSYFAP